MNKLFGVLFACFLFVTLTSFTKRSEKGIKVLVFSKTLGYRHKSIKNGVAAIKKLGAQNGFGVDYTENPSLITSTNLKGYKAIVFLSPTGEFFDESQKAAFRNFIRAGGGFVGIHAAADCLYKWDWYGKMLGAYFKSHPSIQAAVINVVDRQHPSTKGFGTRWKRKDEWYNFNYTNSEINVLLKLDEKSYNGGKNGAYHPIAWHHKFEGGRIFYTGLGHTKASYTSDKYFLQHLLGGIKYAIDQQ